MPLYSATCPLPKNQMRLRTFNPSRIDGLQLWLDATKGLFDATSGGNPVTTDGSTVARWEDQSGSGYNVLQATSANMPILKTAVKNNKNAIRFDGSNDILVSANIPDNNLLSVSVFSVVSPTNFGGGNAGRIFERGANGFLNFMNFSTSIAFLFGDVNVRGGSTTLSAFNLITSTATIGTGTANTRINKVLAASGNMGSSPSLANTTYQIGNRTAGDRAFNGDIAEIIVYNNLLTSLQIDQVEAYLYSKWGLT
jgi:hypothetical protein